MKNKKGKQNKPVNVSISEKALSKDELIRIHEEAYYRAYKRIEIDKTKTVSIVKPFSVRDRVKMSLLFFIKPKWVVKNTKTNFADGLLSLIMVGTFNFIGWVATITSILAVVYFVISMIITHDFLQNVPYIYIFLFLIMIGSFFRAASQELDDEKDKNRLYGYSSCFMSILAVVIALLTFLMTFYDSN